MIACLRTGDDEAANECLERIVTRFGDGHDRVLSLKGLVKEATAANNTELDKILEEYDALLQQNDANIVSMIRPQSMAIPFADDAIAYLEAQNSSSPIHGQSP